MFELFLYFFGFLSLVSACKEVATGALLHRAQRKQLLLERQWVLEDRQALEGSISLLLTNRDLAITVRDKITVALREDRARQLPAAREEIPALPAPRRARKKSS